jgi:ABC-type transporter Mla subunit MlaD
MKEITKALLTAVGLALFLPGATVLAFQLGSFGFVFVTVLFVGAILLVIYSGMTQENAETEAAAESDEAGETT